VWLDEWDVETTDILAVIKAEQTRLRKSSVEVVQAAIRKISTIDGGDPAQFHPVSADFSIPLRITAGPAESEGEETFDLTVCSPAALEKECERDGFVLGRHRIIVRDYDFRLLRRIIEKLIARSSGDSWSEVATKIGRIAYWEFEDYEPTSN